MKKEIPNNKQETIYKYMRSRVPITSDRLSTDIDYHMDMLFQFRENEAWQEITKGHGFFSYVKLSIRKVIRKLIYWYLKPISEKQTHYNNAAFNSLNALRSLSKYLLGSLQSLEQKKSSDNMKHVYEMSSQIDDIYNHISNLSEAIQHYTVNLRQIDEMSTRINELYQHIENIVTSTQSVDGRLDDICQQMRDLTAYSQLTDHRLDDAYLHINNLATSAQSADHRFEDAYLHINNLATSAHSADYRFEDIYRHIGSLTDFNQSIDSRLRQAGIMEEAFNLAKKMTYSQSGEDAITAYILIMLGFDLSKITYIDLGANDPIEINNTYLFYQLGARGVLVEANPNLVPELKSIRHRDTVINAIAACDDGEKIPFYIMNISSMSSISFEYTEKVMQINPELKIESTVDVEKISITRIIREYLKDKAPIILNIDIEENDYELIKSIDFNKYRPAVIIIEVIDFGNRLMYMTKHKDVIEILKQYEYDEYAFTGINSIFVDKHLVEKEDNACG